MEEEQAMKVQKVKDWEANVVVKNKHFKVNTRQSVSHQLDKFNSIREGKVSKLGLRIKLSRANSLASRNIYAKKELSVAPVSMLSLGEEYVMNEQQPKPLKVIDVTKHPRT
jgi:hypothetical protein